MQVLERNPQTEIGLPSSYGIQPKINVIDLPDRICIEADLPGYAKDKLKVELQGDVLCIEGTKTIKTGKWEVGKYLVRELGATQFCKTFHLGESYNRNAIKSRLNNGLLTVEVPKLSEGSVEFTEIPLE